MVRLRLRLRGMCVRDQGNRSCCVLTSSCSQTWAEKREAWGDEVRAIQSERERLAKRQQGIPVSPSTASVLEAARAMVKRTEGRSEAQGRF